MESITFQPADHRAEAQAVETQQYDQDDQHHGERILHDVYHGKPGKIVGRPVRRLQIHRAVEEAVGGDRIGSPTGRQPPFAVQQVPERHTPETQSDDDAQENGPGRCRGG